MSAAIEFTGPRKDRFGGWSRNCRVAGADYSVSVQRDRPVTIPFKPRGKNRGWTWQGAVWSQGRCIWLGRVPGSLGVKGLLIKAGVCQP